MRKYAWDKATDTLTEVSDILEWAEFMDPTGATNMDHRRVARDEFDTEAGHWEVFTSFLGIDHNFFGKGPPLVFETMCTLNGQWQNEQWRYSNSKDAHNLHRGLVEWLKEGKALEDFDPW